MTVGFFSPLPPQRTGVADYSAALLRAMRRMGHVEVAPKRAGINLYHVGNNQLHRDIYRRALEVPGVLVLHDAVLHHFLLGSLSREEYIREFVYNYGTWTTSLAENLWARRARSGADEQYFRYGLLRRIAERSLAVIVHNQAALEVVRAHAPMTRIVEIPHLFEAPVHIEKVQLGLPRKAVLLGVFGHLRESKRILPLLRTMNVLPENAHLLVAGQWASRDLARAAEPYFRHPRIHRIGFTPESEFWGLAQATSICINLRYPSAAETSGIGIRLMGIGRTVLATRATEMASFPSNAYVPIEGGLLESPMLEAALHWLIAQPEALRQIGANAERHIAVWHAPDRIADLYWQTLRQAR